MTRLPCSPAGARRGDAAGEAPRPDKGTPQGGVISPLLLPVVPARGWFDKMFHPSDGR